MSRKSEREAAERARIQAIGDAAKARAEKMIQAKRAKDDAAAQSKVDAENKAKLEEWNRRRSGRR